MYLYNILYKLFLYSVSPRCIFGGAGFRFFSPQLFIGQIKLYKSKGMST